MPSDNDNCVLVERRDHITIVTINRPHVRNAVNRPTAEKLTRAFRDFEADTDVEIFVPVQVYLKALIDPSIASLANSISYDPNDDGPMGPTRMTLRKPVIAAISGYAVAGGLELACWCDLRVADATAVLGVFCRLRGRSAAMDLLLTGRSVTAQEAHSLRLVNELAKPTETALTAALRLATMLSLHPQLCMRSDRQSLYEVDSDQEAMRHEFEVGIEVLRSQEFRGRVISFLAKEGRHGSGLKPVIMKSNL
ncbi:2-ketocyclohexanecarboxyl-CoA hydrolase [Jimgerdemannia flammicorona]|uniref:2-ketocyclohexanecarboxyl-CoA hydrolase n=1 Tax=Jimgerdemannia flammicorona TaxID=994334 RepID=A0A433CXL5_9FUNG|nr:2-ketocyclohexanecarboxyl-CoA hydrolase [Jimgerdemannia flammicorona]